MNNYYQILEVNTNATSQEIKKAYRRLVFKYHPDTNKDIADSTYINLIIEAYETLIDVDLRKNYDVSLFYGKNFTNKRKPSQQETQDNYKKYGNSTRNPTAGTYKPPVNKSKDVKFPLFEKLMYRTLLSFGIIGFVYSIRDLFIKEFDGINSFSGFFFSITFTTLLVVSWRNYKKSDD